MSAETSTTKPQPDRDYRYELRRAMEEMDEWGRFQVPLFMYSLLIQHKVGRARLRFQVPRPGDLADKIR